MSLVLDCSVTIAWNFDDEITPALLDIAQGVEQAGAVVPAIWVLEVANVLTVAERRGRITANDTDGFLADLADLPTDIEPVTSLGRWPTLMQMARDFGLTVHDAACLELAHRRGLPLASLDKALVGAAARLGRSVMPA